MKFLWINKKMVYDGTQLRPLFAYMSEGLLGDSIVSWRGPCQLKAQHIVDGEDLRSNSQIAGEDMLHFIVEKFDCSLFTAVVLQRLMTSMAHETLKSAAIKGTEGEKMAHLLLRSGDDLFYENRKLSISVATVGATSALIHFALNARSEGTPVPTVSLEEMGVTVESFAQLFMKRVVDEVQSMTAATHKVRSLPLFAL